MHCVIHMIHMDEKVMSFDLHPMSLEIAGPSRSADLPQLGMTLSSTGHFVQQKQPGVSEVQRDSLFHSVDGRIPAPPGMYKTL